MKASSSLVAIFAALAIGACSTGGGVRLTPRGLGSSFSPDASGKYIQHVVLIVQENRSFDNLFATFPGVDGATSGYYLKRVGRQARQNEGYAEERPARRRLRYQSCVAGIQRCVRRPGHVSEDVVRHGWLQSRGHNGQNPQERIPYQYIDPADIKPYWAIANNTQSATTYSKLRAAEASRRIRICSPAERHSTRPIA